MEPVNEPQNFEDQRIWECLINFDFESADDIADLKVKLFNALTEKLGRCYQCTAFIPDKSYCSVLNSFTGRLERCSDFEKVEEEDETAFDIMTEEYKDQEKMKVVDARLLKYKRNKKHELNLGGDFT